MLAEIVRCYADVLYLRATLRLPPSIKITATPAPPQPVPPPQSGFQERRRPRLAARAARLLHPASTG